MRLFILFAVLLSSFVHAEEEIFVQLSSEVEMMPVFVSKVENVDSTLPAGYSDSIRQVLLFDLNHNGMTRVLEPKEIVAFSSLANQDQFSKELDFSKLKSDGILYLVKLKCAGNELIAKIISVNAQTANTIDHIFLSGDLNRDRVKVHQLADSIHKLLFGKPGIASSRILYTVKRKIDRPKQEPKWVSDVFVSDYDGHNARQLTNENTLVANPQFLPNSSQFIFVSYKIGQPKIYMGSLNDNKISRVSPLKANQVTPSISHDGQWLAFSSDVTGKADIFLQPLKGGQDVKPRQIFTAKASANASPAFSPDGKRIAFVSNKDGSPKIYVMKIPPEGTKLKDIALDLITKRCRENSAPSWSPDGKKIVYCARNSSPERQIWVFDVETKTERQLTQGSADKENPVWAQDSLHILFNAKDSHGTDIYMINLNQPNAVKITSGPGEKFFPAWDAKKM
ncbi:MAG: Tol-Pal system protein TolB [Verrucomicrobia bacterium]|nr:Tol-Pal system protein TolB [Verrucomicrobiota bacterium]MBS0636049.1 Tol-Pal system protein TolB [Verrucomicrobiota bacterium]